VRGDTVRDLPVYEEMAVRIELFGDEIERLMMLHPLTGEVLSDRRRQELYVFPATHYVAGPERMERAIRGIEAELEERLAEFESQGKLLEAQRLRMRTTYDIEMMRQVGYVLGIENYSMHIDGRYPRQNAPNCLLDYFPEDFLLVVDESHVAVPQLGGMYEGDMSRKRSWSSTGSACPVRWTTGRCAGRSSWSGSARPSTCRDPGATTNWIASAVARTRSSRSSAPPA
jgi:excinuclease ABC subunit B